jgi:hypothetical protein
MGAGATTLNPRVIAVSWKGWTVTWKRRNHDFFEFRRRNFMAVIVRTTSGVVV